jgi:hypothetical protein
MAVQAAFTSCGQQGYSSLSSKCPNFTTIINTAAQNSTSLGGNVSASPSEGNYCVDATTGALTTTGCGTTAHYLSVTTTYSYSALFSNVSVTRLLPSTISQSSWIRTG